MHCSKITNILFFIITFEKISKMHCKFKIYKINGLYLFLE